MSPRQLACGVVVLVVGVLLALIVGPVGLSLEVFSDHELLSLRASRVALAVVVGAGLAVVGAALQALLRNPLADPFVLGVSGGAAMGAAVLLGVTAFFGVTASIAVTVPGAVVGAAVASALLVAFVAKDGRDGDSAVLVGVVINAFSWAIVAVVRVVLPAGEAAGLSIWLIGALQHPSSSSLAVAAVVTVVGIAIVVRQAGALQIIRGGDDDARRLGIDLQRVRVAVVVASSAIVAVAVATTGVIGFVGLLVPHAVRRLGAGRFDSDDRTVIPLAALGGGGALAALDGVARGAFAVVGSELPTGAVCALLGAPLLAALLLRDAGGRR